MGIIIVATLASQTALNSKLAHEYRADITARGAVTCYADGACVSGYYADAPAERGSERVDTVRVASQDLK